MAVKDEQIIYINTVYPDASGDNTEFCLRFWETVCEQHDIEFPEDVKWAIRQYKPEAITRKRRELVSSSKEQVDKEEQTRQHYSN